MYRGVDDVMNALQPVLAKNKIFVCPEVLEQTREERVSGKGNNLLYSILRIRFTFYAEDGTNVSVTTLGEAMDSGDKASNKAMSVAFKYAMFQIFCIPTEEMVDPDGDTPPATTPRGKQETKKPAATDKISEETANRIIKGLSFACGEKTEDQRHLLLNVSEGKYSSVYDIAVGDAQKIYDDLVALAKQIKADKEQGNEG